MSVRFTRNLKFWINYSSHTSGRICRRQREILFVAYQRSNGRVTLDSPRDV
jgi:hypothetical protein